MPPTIVSSPPSIRLARARADALGVAYDEARQRQAEAWAAVAAAKVALGAARRRHKVAAVAAERAYVAYRTADDRAREAAL
ncbi:MAG: hypothetical protein LBD97_02230 [Bifidobacteriaceae bacterium]|jgi:hypothetical protein|nr:hypothetical protein [Bifidobacteriaceae bacterium]